MPKYCIGQKDVGRIYLFWDDATITNARRIYLFWDDATITNTVGCRADISILG